MKTFFVTLCFKQEILAKRAIFKFCNMNIEVTEK